MYRIHPAYLAWVLEALVDGEVVNEIVVADRVKAAALVALARMLSLPGQPAPHTAARGIGGPELWGPHVEVTA
jgi:hypothetical protein